MTKTNARAVLSAQRRINGILDGLRNKLTGDDLAYFENYWGSGISDSMNSDRYGCAPITRAEQTLTPEQN